MYLQLVKLEFKALPEFIAANILRFVYFKIFLTSACADRYPVVVSTYKKLILLYQLSKADILV